MPDRSPPRLHAALFRCSHCPWRGRSPEARRVVGPVAGCVRVVCPACGGGLIEETPAARPAKEEERES